MSHPNNPPRHPQRQSDGLTPEERAVADAAVARMRAAQDVAAADARGRAVIDPYGSARLTGLGPSAHAAGRNVAPPPAPRNGFGLTALIVALVGILFGLVPLTGFIAVICAFVAIPLALVGRSRVRKGRATNGRTTVAGLLLAVVALVFGIWGIVIVFGAVNQLADDLGGPAPVGAPAVSGPVSGQQAAAEAEAEQGTADFGQRVTFDNGLAVEITEPQPYQPSRYAAGADGDRAVRFDVTLINDSDEPFDAVLTQVRATHGGRQVSQIFDAEGGSENPQGTILPGKSLTFSVALSLDEAVGDLQVEISPDFLGEPAIFIGEV